MTMSRPSKKSAVRRRKKGHLMLNDWLYHTSMCVMHQDSRGLREAVVEAEDADDDCACNGTICSAFPSLLFLWLFIGMLLLENASADRWLTSLQDDAKSTTAKMILSRRFIFCLQDNDVLVGRGCRDKSDAIVSLPFFFANHSCRFR